MVWFPQSEAFFLRISEKQNFKKKHEKIHTNISQGKVEIKGRELKGANEKQAARRTRIPKSGNA